MTVTETSSTTVVHTACTLDCPDACSLAVTVTDGKIVDIDASPLNPLTQGWICSKVKRHAKRVYAPERVMTPLIRTGAKGSGEFRKASWDEAMVVVGERMRAALNTAGPDSIVGYTYNSSAGVRESSSLTDAFFAALGATQVDHTICAATAGAAWRSVYRQMSSADPLDVVHSDLVVIWGANPTVSNTHFPPLVNQAADRGAKVVVIDPRRTAMAKRADLHLAIRPGTDVALALAVANYWIERDLLDGDFLAAHADGLGEFVEQAATWSIERAAEVTGLAADDIVTFADWYGSTKPAMLRIGWGPERNANGGASCRAILVLPVLVNHFGVRGGGVIGATRGDVDATTLWPHFDAPARRAVAMHQIGQWLAPTAGDPCQVLIIQGANPIVMCPDTTAVLAAFERDDVFTVVHEQVMTDTARYADVVLPATTAFEIDDIAIGYGTYTAQRVRPVIDRVGESRSNDEFGLALANQMGWDWMAQPALDVNPDGDRSAELRVTVESMIQFVDTEPDGGRAQLTDREQGPPRFVPVAATASLQLISPASSKLVNSMFGEFQSPEPTVLVHPDDASRLGVSAGQSVRLSNGLGAVSVTVAVGDDTRPGVCVVLKGIWPRNFADGVGLNVLIPATGDALVNGACFNDTYVDIEV